MEPSLDQLKYPTGGFRKPKEYNHQEIQDYIQEIEDLPQQLEQTVNSLRDEQLDTMYRPDGWTIRQVVHHIADSHMNSYVRFRWTLTEDQPTIKAYYEDRWAEMEDARTAPVRISLDLIKALHARWILLLRSMKESDMEKSFIHPESGAEIKLYVNIALYAWHCRHHLAHINDLIKRKNW